SVQSSLRRQFGLATDGRRIPPAERGIAEMMVDLYKRFAEPLTHQTMFDWHKMIMSGGERIDVVGAYRTRSDPMQIVSGAIDRPRVHFEAPPSARMQKEMSAFVSWFNTTAPTGKHGLPALTRAGISHL